MRVSAKPCGRSFAVYAGGTLGGHHDHRHPDRAVAAGGAGGPRGGPASAVPEQPQATRPGLPEPRERHEAFPTGGWGCGWTGDADRGTDWRQPGGWIYNILPYIEQQALHDLGAGQPDPRMQGPRQYAADVRPAGDAQLSHAAAGDAYPWSRGWMFWNARQLQLSLRRGRAAITPPTAAMTSPTTRTAACVGDGLRIIRAGQHLRRRGPAGT